MDKVLIVDDEPLVAAALSRLLRRRGFATAIASCGEAALEMLDQFGPDVVVSDFKMPGMNGANLLTEVERRRPSTRRILLSGYANLIDTEPGNYVFLSKPWDDQALVLACRGTP